MNKPVLCNSCKKPVASRRELVTTKRIFKVYAYHDECYEKDLKGKKSFLLDNYPINGMSGTLSVILSFLLMIFLYPVLDIIQFGVIAVLFLITGFYRIYSFILYEKVLPAKKSI
jgi:hypothetical protein